ncbi:hypothetical protein OG763_09940 [Streptomyces sp. NBC_01230]|nr:hypothetical protein OG763_09940 [Streptomyces sp. NBC_01230]
MSTSPFGPAADKARDERIRVELDRLSQEAVETSKKLVELYKG